MVSLLRRMEGGWVQLSGRWIEKDFYNSVVFLFKVEPNGCSIHILALAVLLGHRWISLSQFFFEGGG